MQKNSINIKSRLGRDFSSEVLFGDRKYIIETEADPKKSEITSRIYLKGQIVSSRKTDFKHLKDGPDKEKHLQELMWKQHRSVEKTLRKELSETGKTPSEYLEEVNLLLRRKSKKSAFKLISEALEAHPGDPFLLSYYGCLQAVANKNFHIGISACSMAIETLREKVPFGEDIFYPTLYLNLGRAYLAADRKAEAVSAFKKGEKFDRENSDILWELKKLGIRKTPPISFLTRSNPINKYIGMMLHKLAK